MTDTHFITVLLAVVSALWFLLVGVVGYSLRRINEKLDELGVHQTGCIRAYADRTRNAEDHKEFYRRTDDHERRLTLLEAERERKV